MTPSKKAKSEKPSRSPLLLFSLLALLVLIVGGVIYALMSSPAPAPGAEEPYLLEPGTKIQDGMVIQLAESCSRFQKVLSDTPLVLEYGYWGYLPEYEQQNLDNLVVEIYLDGVLIDSVEETFERVRTRELPCVDLSQHSSAFVESGQWAYASLEHPGLPRGEYVVEVVFYLRERVATGRLDAGGEMLYYGPGEVYRFTKELLVE